MPARNPPSDTAWSPSVARLTTLLLCIGFWLACAVPAHADGQVWALASITKTVAADWRVSAEFAPRWERDVSDYSRNVLRAQVMRGLSRGIAVGGGYEFTDSRSPVVRQEQRIYEQVQVLQRVGRWTLSHRGRLEQRWLHLAPSVVVRTRYQFRAAHPIANSRRWSWQVFDEVLYTLRGTGLGPLQGLDRHRVGGGISRVLSEHITVESGYTWQVINRPASIANQHDHFAVFSLLARY